MPPRVVARSLALVLCVLVVGVGPVAPAAERAAGARDFSPGASGVGDGYFPNAGNGGYDAVRYAVRMRYYPSNNRLTATTSMRATARKDLSRFNLDLDGLTVREVTVDGRPARYDRVGGELRITPARGITKGAQFVSRVVYDGVPRTLSDGSGFIHTDDGSLVVGEPKVASTWMPVNDHPRDKAVYSFRVTAPYTKQVVANGLVTERRRVGDLVTWTWQVREPMASYLATVNVGRFTFTRRVHDGLVILDAIDPDLLRGGSQSEGAVARKTFARQGEVIDFLASRFGDYPVSAAGGIVDDTRGLGFALENQTRPVYARDFFTDDLSAETVVVHELAHQWFGDDVALDRWRDIWLNEGFATYAEWLWNEHEGYRTAAETFEDTYDGYPAASSFWRLRIGDPGRDHLFDEAVYVRGAMTLHVLREEIGDADFFTLLKRWASTHARGNVRIPQFVAMAEQVSGEQLDDLFEDWLFTPRRPAVAGADQAALLVDRLWGALGLDTA